MTPRERRDPGPESLLVDVLQGLPRLDGAACTGQAWLFDDRHLDEDAADAEYRHHRAATICTTCPALLQCRTWSAALPPTKRPGGVVAGHIPDRPGRGRPKKKETRMEEILTRTDRHRAAVVLRFAKPDAVEIEGINVVLQEAHKDGRGTQLVLSLCGLAYGFSPDLAGDDAQQTLARFIIDHLDDDLKD